MCSMCFMCIFAALSGEFFRHFRRFFVDWKSGFADCGCPIVCDEVVDAGMAIVAAPAFGALTCVFPEYPKLRWAYAR